MFPEASVLVWARSLWGLVMTCADGSTPLAGAPVAVCPDADIMTDDNSFSIMDSSWL